LLIGAMLRNLSCQSLLRMAKIFLFRAFSGNDIIRVYDDEVLMYTVI
jgi:hypothetical protein